MATTDTQATPTGVAQLATERVHLDRVALLGIFGTQSAPAALVREADGDTARVQVGDRVAGGTVTAIGEDRVVVSRATGQKVLRLPKG
ncbi:pilus assembly protein PilP [uncultured Sulfitobacter sp.]|uniref:pilus assembly protein PilP n=1 Tax=uncultured Sulfitobacter sp. TaxID=191468 RepID=UPI002612A150|nr:pilus assembly protein PilP [uncultured Sulfitobacter sp.]